MQFTSFLTFELGAKCNLGKVHVMCPNMSPERYGSVETTRQLDDDTIIATAARMYLEFGFRGMVAWHYYNEPTIYAERMFAIMRQLLYVIPQVRFVLWTNGTMIPHNCADYSMFSRIFVTDYSLDGHPPRNIDKLKSVCRSVTVSGDAFDTRLTAIHVPFNSTSACKKPFVEFILDTYGNVHFCCVDWRGQIMRRNVFNDDLAEIISMWQNYRAEVAGCRMTDKAPPICQCCSLRQHSLVILDPTLQTAIGEYHARLCRSGSGHIT